MCYVVKFAATFNLARLQMKNLICCMPSTTPRRSSFKSLFRLIWLCNKKFKKKIKLHSLQLQGALSPCIESLIILDRLLFIQEKVCYCMEPFHIIAILVLKKFPVSSMLSHELRLNNVIHFYVLFCKLPTRENLPWQLSIMERVRYIYSVWLT